MNRPTKASEAGRAYLDLQNLARRQRKVTGELLTMYVVERWLARLAVSPHRDDFILKGGMLLASLGARRPTADADALAHNRLQQALELAGEAPRFDTRTQYRYNNQRTLRVCVAFEIDDESVRRYRLKMEDSVTTLATGEHSERSFADFGTLRRDFSRSRWDGSGRGFVLNLFGEGNLLRVEAPLDWVSKGRFGRSTEDAPPNRVERHSVRLVQRDHLSPHQFWQLIGSLDGRPSDSTAIAALAQQLAALGEGAIKTFAIYLNEALAALDTEEHREQPVWDITAESDTSPISLSDDCFLYARCSVIGKGEANWRRTVLQPSKMRGVHDLGAEQLLYVSVLALSQL